MDEIVALKAQLQEVRAERDRVRALLDDQGPMGRKVENWQLVQVLRERDEARDLVAKLYEAWMLNPSRDLLTDDSPVLADLTRGLLEEWGWSKGGGA